MSKTHEGRVAVVTGAARGIGRAICAKLSERGARLVLVDREDCAQTAGALAGESISITADIAADADWARIAARTMAAFGRADIVVNNAGIYPMASIDELTIDLWRSVFAVNLEAHFFSAKHFVPLMRANKYGRFVNISSNSVGAPTRGLSHYMASKMGVIGFVRGLANDVAEDGITVNAVMPAFTDTPGTASAPEAIRQRTLLVQAIKRVALPDDIAGPVVFLTSDDAGFVTGQAIVADGGMYKIS
jgi:3-oxoacyl-[acyl-carrier protein] reductase